MPSLTLSRSATSLEREAQQARDVKIGEIKAECERRILKILPEWKQRNLTAQATILVDKGRDNWSPEDLAAWNAGEALWLEIALLRAKSDELEALDPLPDDVTDPDLWD